MKQIELTVVICSHPTRGKAAFGVTFHDDAEAAKYTEAMRKAGYEADSMDYFSELDAESAIASTAAHFNDPTLAAEAIK